MLDPSPAQRACWPPESITLRDKLRAVCCPILGKGHVYATLLAGVSGLGWAFGIRQLAGLLGFTSPAQMLMVQKGKKTHISVKILILACQPCILAEAQRVYKELHPARTSFNVDEFMEWARTAGPAAGDAAFTAFMEFWILDTVPAFILFRASLRDGNFTAMIASLKKLAWLLFARGATNYAGAVVGMVAQTLYQYPEEVLTQVAQFFVVNGQGFDYDLEQIIKCGPAFVCLWFCSIIIAHRCNTFVERNNVM